VEGQQARMRAVVHLRATLTQHNACKPECFLLRRYSPSSPACRAFHQARVQLPAMPLWISWGTLPFARAGTAPCGGCVTDVAVAFPRARLLQCLQALRSSSSRRHSAPSALGDPLEAASSLFAQCLGPRVAVQPHSSHRPAPSYNTRRYYTSTGYRAATIRTNP
jgi:hypothetical protein